MEIRKMKMIVFGVALLLVGLPTAVFAQSAGERKTVKRLIDSLEYHYFARSLGSLDRRRPLSGKVKVVIEHSLLDGKDQYEVKNFATLAGVERWLRSREVPGAGDFMVPIREVRDTGRCGKGVCTYSLDGGILHNHLYLTRVRYAYRKGRAYLKTIYLYDGD